MTLIPLIPLKSLEKLAIQHNISGAELAALQLALLDGKETTEIATELKISVEAVRKRLSEVYKKFQIDGAGPGKLAKLQLRLVSEYQKDQKQLGEEGDRKKQRAKPGQDEGETPLLTPEPDVENPPDPDPPLVEPTFPLGSVPLNSAYQGYEAVSERGVFFPKTSSTNHQNIFPNTIALIVENPDSLTRENMLKQIRVRAVTPGALGLFGLLDAPSRGNNNWSWEDIVKNLRSQRWTEELLESLYSVHCGMTPRGVQLTFRSSEGKLFRPILYKKESLTNGSERFTILFVEIISKGCVDNAPSLTLATLLTASNLGARLQWEVCDKYLPMLEHWQRQGSEAIKRKLREVKISFENIEEDAKFRGEGEAGGLMNEVKLRYSFESEDERNTIADNLSKQEVYKQIVRNADDTQDNVNEVRDALINIRSLNSIFMKMVARRYSQLLNESSP